MTIGYLSDLKTDGVRMKNDSLTLPRTLTTNPVDCWHRLLIKSAKRAVGMPLYALDKTFDHE